MTRCVEFYEKWERDGNWCEICKAGASQINSYLDILNEFQKAGIPKKFTIVNFPELAARPLFSEKNASIREALKDRIMEVLRQGKRCTTGDTRRFLIALKYASPDRAQLSHNVSYKLLSGSFQEKGAEVGDESVSLVFTDPPYGPDYLSLWPELGKLSQRVLVPGGFLIAFAGQGNLDKKLAALAKYLSYYWTFAYLFTIQNIHYDVRIYQSWKAIVAFFKPPLHTEGYFQDVLKGSGLEKDLHPWQQSEADTSKFIEHFCPFGGIVLDPMAGSGTTLAAAVKLGHSCIGIDIDPANIEVMKRRLGNGAGQK